MSVQSIIPVIADRTISQEVQLVDAKALHRFLEIDARFNDWIARRIAEYGFQEGEDFYSALSKSTGGRRSREYRITLDMGKELAMVERNEKGKQARRYFIECEKRLAQIAPRDAATIMNQTIGTDGFHMLSAIVKGKVTSLPASVQRRATAKIWSQVHAAFGVRSAADIPAEHLDGARNFIAAYAVVEGEFLPKRKEVQIVGSPRKRYLVAFDHKGVQVVKEVADDECVLSTRDLIKGMVSPGDIPVSTQEMFEFLMAAVVNIRGRYECLARRTAK
ncbi:antA/AntB antirepressor family protein [Pseudomonas putida]|uniref:antA/AntB antirepressor family protein n=1 Tax=Pseudomonas putida TaxID=303 RepID=UPI00066D4A3D|nr:antA/AntB antirepressor family protein [Pseudomonas putida]